LQELSYRVADAKGSNLLAFDFYSILFHLHYYFLGLLKESMPIDFFIKPVLALEHLIFHVGLGPAICLRSGDSDYFYRLSFHFRQRGRLHCIGLHLTNPEYSDYFRPNLMMTFFEV
jgi:hypothetical protein